MFYNQSLLSNEGPLATVWLAANLDKKLSKSQLLHTNISKSAKAIINSDNPREGSQISGETSREGSRVVVSQPIALRLSGQLLYGVVKIYSRKERYLLDDVSNVLIRLKTVFKSTSLQSVTLPANKTIVNVNKLVLPDTITEANIVPQLLQQEPLLFDLEETESAGAAPGAPDYTDFQFSVDLDQSVEQGRNISRRQRDETFDLGLEKEGAASPAPHAEDDLAAGDDLVLDFGFEDMEPVRPHIAESSPARRGPQDVAENEPRLPPADTYQELDFGDQTVEHGRRMSVSELDDITFGADALLKEAGATTPQPAIEEEPQHEIFEQEPLEAIPEVEPEQEQAETAAVERRPGRQSVARREARKRLIFDDEIEIPTAEFQRSQAETVSPETEARAVDKRRQLRRKLLETKRLFYLKKYANPGNMYVDSGKFRRLWDTKAVEIEPEHHTKRRRIEEETVPIPELEAPQEEQDFNFDLNFDDNFDPNEEYETLEAATSDTRGAQSKTDVSESFLQQLTSNEMVSSMVGSAEYRREGLEEDRASLRSQLARGDIETSSQTESQFGETSSKSISNSTLRIASILRDEFVGDQEKKITMQDVIAKDTSSDDIDEPPLSTDSKKEAVRCFFELLVLATGDAITLKQDRLFGEIAIGCKNTLFERF